MANGNVFLVLSAILAVLVVIFSVKNFLVRFHLSESGFKNILLIALVVIVLYACLSCISSIFSMQDALDQLKANKNLSSESIKVLKESALDSYNKGKTSLFVAGGSFIGSLTMYFNIKRETSREFAKAKDKSRWDLNKLGK